MGDLRIFHEAIKIDVDKILCVSVTIDDAWPLGSIMCMHMFGVNKMLRFPFVQLWCWATWIVDVHAYVGEQCGFSKDRWTQSAYQVCF